MSKKDYAICINDEYYAFNLQKLKEFCLTSDKEGAKDQEIVDNWVRNPDTGEMDLESKINRESRTQGNPQNDTISYDMIKLFLTVILGSGIEPGKDFNSMDFSTAIAFNTLLKEEIIYKL